MNLCPRISKDLAPNRLISALMMLLALMFIVSGSAYAFIIPTGSEDVVIHFDNTLRYTLMERIASQNQSIINSPNGDDGDRNFARGIVSNRLDLLTEADITIKNNFGARVSGAFWFDQAYSNAFTNTSVATSNYRDEMGVPTVNRLEKNSDKYAHGPNGELLDAFVFGRVNLGPVPVSLKLGRHIYSWGQGLLNPYNTISYGQMPIDVAKGQSNPGIEAKELFRPTNMASAIVQLMPSLQIAGQYFLQNERNLLPGAGTYWGTADIETDGSGNMIVGPGPGVWGGFYAVHGRDVEAARNKDYGVAVQWSPESLSDTTLGFYYRRFSDRMPQFILDIKGDGVSVPTYHVAFKSEIELYGLSYASTILGQSVGAEVSYRHNMPLNSGAAMIASAAGQTLPEDGQTLGAVGDTFHGLVNVMGLLKKTPVWDAGNWIVEFDYAAWLRVNADPYGVFKGSDAYRDTNAFDRVTRDAGQIYATFTPQYLQILPGLDLDVPLSINYGIWGVSPVAGAITGEGDAQLGVGLNFTYLTKYKLNFSYANYMGELADSAAGAVARGNFASYRDRDFISMVFKFSF